MVLLNILIGAALLFFGRRVFWLFIAGMGFVAGVSFADQLLQGPEWLSMVIGLGLGIFTALLAIFVQHFAIGLAGFLAGGYIAWQLVLPLLNIEHGWIPWLTFLIGGIIGVILVGAVLDWALIILSSLAGSALIVEVLKSPQFLSALVFIALAAIGISVQARGLRRSKH